MSINVIAGEPSLFEITVTNPFDAKKKFHVEILDDDFKNDYIDDHELSLVDD
jgi:hypothetical protein